MNDGHTEATLQIHKMYHILPIQMNKHNKLDAIYSKVDEIHCSYLVV